MKPKLLVPLAALLLLASASMMAKGPAYDPATVVNVRGSVTWVAAEHPSGAGTYLVVRDGINEMVVILGPADYIDQTGFRFESGDNVEVVGSKVAWKGGEVIVARSLVLKGRTLVLRDENGKAHWKQ